MKTVQFLGVAGALLTASCHQMQQIKLLEREPALRAPNGHWQQVVVFGRDNEGSFVSVMDYANKKAMKADIQKHPIGSQEYIVGWKGDGYVLEHIGGGGAALYVSHQKGE